MNLSRIDVVLGTRPEAIKLAPVIHALRSTDWAQVRVVATAQHRDLLAPILAFFGIDVDLTLDAMRDGQSLAELTARLVEELGSAFAVDRPDLVIAQGDTTTVLAAALCSFYLRTPFAHVEAGLRTGDPRAPFPEEMNRRLVTNLASLHFAPTAAAVANLRAEGVAADAIVMSGNPVVDALLWAAARTGPSAFAPSGRALIVVTMHRRESFGAPLARICTALRRLAARGDVEILLPVHPNPQVRDLVHRELAEQPAIRLVPPLAYPDFVAALRACTLVLTDSGGVQEEAPTFGKPVLILRDTTERVEAVDAGVAELVGTDAERIVARTARLLDDETARDTMTGVANPFGDGHAAERIVAELGRRMARTRGAQPE